MVRAVQNFFAADYFKNRERLRLKKLERYRETTTSLAGFNARIPDGPSFLSSYTEIFERGIYNFQACSDSPRILDCGANIGLSTIYFKRLYPGARITAYEPDPAIFAFLKDNLQEAGITDVELVRAAVWSHNGTLQFAQEGADAGHIEENAGSRTINIPAVALNERLEEPVDFLKVDIEGAEIEVFASCRNALSNVDKLFVEYHSFAGRAQRLHELLAILNEAGFRVHVESPFYNPQPFRATQLYLGMDLQLNIFCGRT